MSTVINTSLLPFIFLKNEQNLNKLKYQGNPKELSLNFSFPLLLSRDDV